MKQLQLPPSCFSEFEHINRYWDPAHNTWVAKILPGQYYITKQSNEAVATTLGSCVSACIRDKKLGIGGMNHFMLPVKADYANDDWMDSAMRYGSFAMEYLINQILRHGGSRNNLEVKLAGGGKVIAKMSDVGARNIDFVLDYLRIEGMAVEAQDLGDIYPRKVMYYPSSGRMRIKRLRNLQNETLFQREQAYQQELDVQPDAGEIELF